jgi:predicted phage-related endonuclease
LVAIAGKAVNMLTPEQLKVRQSYVCASDVAAILGVDEWKTPLMVYGEKVHGHTREPGEAAIAGQFLERAVVDWCVWKLEKKLGRPDLVVAINVMRIANNQFMAANYDAISRPGEPCLIIEAKTTGITGPCDEGFGRAGTQQLPRRVIIQCHAQMLVAGPEYRIVYVPVLRGGKGFGLYHVDRNDKLCDLIEQRCREWWQAYVIPKIPPPRSDSDTETQLQEERTAAA